MTVAVETGLKAAVVVGVTDIAATTTGDAAAVEDEEIHTKGKTGETRRFERREEDLEGTEGVGVGDREDEGAGDNPVDEATGPMTRRQFIEDPN